MMLARLTLSMRSFSTKGRKKTRRLEEVKRQIKKSTPPRLPWYLHKKAPEAFTAFVTDKEKITRIFEQADLMYKVIMSETLQVPLEESVQRLRTAQLRAEKERWMNREIPKIIKQLRIATAEREKLALQMLEDKSSVDEIRTFGDVSSEKLVSSPQDAKSSDPLTEVAETSKSLAMSKLHTTLVPYGPRYLHELTRKAEEIAAIEWSRYSASLSANSSDALLAQLKEYDVRGTKPSSYFAYHVVSALERDGKIEEAWKAFLDFTSMRDIWAPNLVERGIVLCGKRGHPERALNYFEMAEIKFGRSYAPMFFHPIMSSCSFKRGMTPYAFKFYDRMTKVNSLKPNEKTLSILLQACAILGDVSRAQKYWEEIVEKGDVVPDEDCVVNMLRCYAQGNQMLRARVLKKESVKVVTGHDKYLLAQAAGFTPPKVDRTDEARRVIQELERGNIDVLDEFDDDQEVAEVADDDGADQSETLDESLQNDETPRTEALQNRSTEHVIFLPGVSPERVPNALPSNFEAVYDNIIKLRQKVEEAAAAKKNENELVPGAKEGSNQLTVKDENDPGRRQEANIVSARNLVAEVERRSGRTPSLRIKNFELKVITSALRLNRAKEYVKALEEQNIQPDRMTWNLLIAMYCRAQRVEQAKEIFAKAKERGEVDKLTVGPLVDAIARTGKVDAALELYKEYENLGILEKHLRYLRFKLKDDARVGQLPLDPNEWRSREYISKQLRALGRDPSSKKMLNHMRALSRA